MEPDAGKALEVAEQLSVGAGIMKLTAAWQKPASLFAVISAGHAATGSSVSFTVTLNVHVFRFPEASSAVTVTTVTPTLKVEPDAGEALEVTPEQLSDDAGKTNVATALHTPLSLFTVTSAGHAATGFSASITVIVNVQSSILFEGSVAVTVTGVTPTGKVDPEA